MINMMSAKEAFNESKYRKDADKFLKEIAGKIKSACEQGEFEVTIKIPTEIRDVAADLAMKDLREKGYRVWVTKKIFGYEMKVTWDFPFLQREE